ncbi:MAG: hypothetical protein IIC03_15095 [Proteobacteria bacterium]|nr:hypothetical protein [Pseudomonadota bacterium]
MQFAIMAPNPFSFQPEAGLAADLARRFRDPLRRFGRRREPHLEPLRALMIVRRQRARIDLCHDGIERRPAAVMQGRAGETDGRNRVARGFP